MPPARPDLQTLLRDLASGPLELADGLTLLSHDVDLSALASPLAEPQGALRASFFGREIKLRAARSTADHGADGGVAFEGSIAEPLVNLGALGELSLTRVALRSPSPGASTNRGDVSSVVVIDGTGRLELRGLANLGTVVLDGALSVETGGASLGRFLRLHFQGARVDLPVAGGASLSLSFKHVYFLWQGEGDVEIEMTATVALAGLPPAIQEAIPGAIPVDVEITPRGLRARASSLFEGITIPIPAIPAVGDGAPAALDELRLSASNLIVTLGRQLAGAVDVQITLPTSLRSIAEPSFSLRLTANATDLEVHLLSSPLRAVTLTPSANGPAIASIDLGPYGQGSLPVPVFRVDWAARCLIAEGLVRYRELRLPLDSVLALLRARGMSSLADRLPAALILRPTGIAGAASMIADIVQTALGRGALGERAREALAALAERADHLPARLRGSFFSSGAPPELGLRLLITADLDAKIAVFVPPDAAPLPPTAATGAPPSRAEPLKVLLPVLGPSGPDLVGVSLYQFAVSQLLRGQLLTVEIDADIDRFPLLPIALSTTLATSGLFSSPERIEQRLTLRDLFLVAVPTAGPPALVPLFFEQIGLSYQGIDGTAIELRYALPSPIRDFASLAGVLRGTARRFASPAERRPVERLPPELRLALTVGPAFVRLPPFLGARTLGSTSPGPPIEASVSVARALDAAKDLDLNALLAVIPDDFGERDVDIELGPTYKKALRLWTTAIAPALGLASRAARSAQPEPAQAPKTDSLSGRLSALRGHIAQGVAALAGDAGKAVFRARVVAVSSEGLRIRTSVARSADGGPSAPEIELRWDNLVGSAARLLGEHDAG